MDGRHALSLYVIFRQTVTFALEKRPAAGVAGRVPPRSVSASIPSHCNLESRGPMLPEARVPP